MPSTRRDFLAAAAVVGFTGAARAQHEPVSLEERNHAISGSSGLVWQEICAAHIFGNEGRNAS